MQARTKRPAVVYYRVSSVQQGRTDGGWSLQSQEARAGEYTKRYGLKITRVFEEVASAWKRGRPVFAELVAYLREHMGTALVVEKMDRLARNSHDLATVDDLIDANVEIHLVRDSRVLTQRSSPGERLSSDIEGAVAKHYSRNLGREVKKGHAARFAAGYFPVGLPPYGYTYPLRHPGERTNIVPDPKEAKIIVKLFEAYTTGEGASFHEIVALANQLGYQHPRGGEMSPSTARKMLSNPAYAGWIRLNGESIRGLHEPIITQSLFDEAMARMAARSRTSAPSIPRSKLEHAFTGIFACAHCGGSITRRARSNRTRTIFWICIRRCDQAKHFPELDLVMQVGEHLDMLRLPRARVDKVVAKLNEQDAPKVDCSDLLLAAIKREGKKRERLLDLYNNDHITRDQFVSRNRASVQAETGLREELARLHHQEMLMTATKQVNLCRELSELFAKGTEIEQRRILKLLWETNRTDRSKLDGVRRRIEPNWRPKWRALVAAEHLGSSVIRGSRRFG